MAGTNVGVDRYLGHSLTLDAHTKEFSEVLRTGEYYSMQLAQPNQGGESLTADRLYAVPFLVTRTRTFDRIAIDVTTSQAGSAIRLGIYEDGTNLAPGALVLDAGTIASTATGVKTIAISKQLTKGLYWLAAYNQVVNVAIERHVPVFSLMGLVSSDLALAYAMWYYDGTYGVLPDPFTTPTGFFNHTAVVIALRLLTND